LPTPRRPYSTFTSILWTLFRLFRHDQKRISPCYLVTRISLARRGGNLRTQSSFGHCRCFSSPLPRPRTSLETRACYDQCPQRRPKCPQIMLLTTEMRRKIIMWLARMLGRMRRRSRPQGDGSSSASTQPRRAEGMKGVSLTFSRSFPLLVFILGRGSVDSSPPLGEQIQCAQK
jgi:hypothetical protein